MIKLPKIYSSFQFNQEVKEINSLISFLQKKENNISTIKIPENDEEEINIVMTENIKNSESKNIGINKCNTNRKFKLGFCKRKKYDVESELEKIKNTRGGIYLLEERIKKYEKENLKVHKRSSPTKFGKFKSFLGRNIFKVKKRQNVYRGNVQVEIERKRDLLKSKIQSTMKRKKFLQLQILKESQNLEINLNNRYLKSRKKRSRVYTVRNLSVRKRKFQFLIVFLSRVSMFDEIVQKNREERRDEMKRENLKTCANLLMKFVKERRKLRRDHAWKLWKNVFGFSYIWIRLLKRKKSILIVKEFAVYVKKSSQRLNAVFHRFTQNVKRSQFLIRKYLAFKKSRIMITLLQFKIEESRILLSKDEKMNYHVLPLKQYKPHKLFNELKRFSSVHSSRKELEDPKVLDSSPKIIKHSSFTRNVNGTLIMEKKVRNKIIKHSSLTRKVNGMRNKISYIRVPFSIVYPLLEKYVQKKIGQVYHSLIEFNQFRMMSSKNGNSFYTDYPKGLFLVNDEEIKEILITCLNKTRIKCDKNSRTKYKQKEINFLQTQYEENVEDVDNALYKYYSKKFYDRRKQLFLSAEIVILEMKKQI